MNKLRIALIVAMAFLFSSALPTFAQCFQYGEIDWECSGTNCQQEIQLSTCDVGCHAGMCIPNGNTRQCCGAPVHYAQLTLQCHDCTPLPIRFHLKDAHPNQESRADLMQGYTAGVVMLTDSRGYRPPELLETYSRCNRSYGLSVYEGQVIVREGM